MNGYTSAFKASYVLWNLKLPFSKSVYLVSENCINFFIFFFSLTDNLLKNEWIF